MGQSTHKELKNQVIMNLVPFNSKHTERDEMYKSMGTYGLHFAYCDEAQVVSVSIQCPTSSFIPNTCPSISLPYNINNFIDNNFYSLCKSVTFRRVDLSYLFQIELNKVSEESPFYICSIPVFCRNI